MARRAVAIDAKAARLADWLVRTALPGAAHPCDAFDATPLEQWLSSASTKTALTPDGQSLFAGCAAAFIATARSLGQHEVPDTTPLLPRPVATAPGAWSGFVPAGDQWLSIAISNDHERDTALRCLNFQGVPGNDLDALRDCSVPATALAATLQEWGIASFPASTLSGGIPRASLKPASLRTALLGAGLSVSRALAGARIIDCGQLISAPWASALLSLLGADVIAVAHPARARNRHYGADPVRLDLATTADRRRFAALCVGTDLVLDNFRPRHWSNLGIEPLELGARCHLSLPAFPRSDPRSNFKCYGFQLEALHAAGHVPAAESSTPVPAPPHGLLDHAAGFAGAVAAVAAIVGGGEGPKELSHLSLLQQIKGTPL